MLHSGMIKLHVSGFIINYELNELPCVKTAIKISAAGFTGSAFFIERSAFLVLVAAAAMVIAVNAVTLGGKNSLVGKSIRLNSSQGLSLEVMHSFSGIQKS
mgnify:CR=1 FL=1